jgi:predicted metal-dependent hydrolase
MTEMDSQKELQRQAALPPTELLIKGIHEFNAGAYFEQHETLETAWREEPGPIRQMYQGILQIGVAYYQIQRQNYTGALRMFQRAWQYLDPLPDVCQGVNIAQFRIDASAAQTELERLGPQRIASFSSVFFKPIRVKTTTD